jgi:hypothetical protein
MASRTFETALALALVLVTAGAARAQSDGDKKQAQALQVDGVALMKKGDNKGALEKFDQAFKLVASPKILFNRGKAHRALGEDLEALSDFERFLDEAPYAPKESRDEARRAIDALRPKLAYLEFQVEDSGSAITVDGRDVGIAPLARPLVVSPGTHQIKVAKSGMKDEVRSVSPIAGQKLRVVVKLVAVAEPTQPQQQQPVVATSTPEPVANDSAGGATVTPPKEDIRKTAPVESSRPWQTTAAWVSGGIGVALIGGGVVAQLMSSSKNAEFNAVKDAPNSSMMCNEKLSNAGGGNCQALLDAAHQRQTLAIVGFAAGGAALVAALIFVLTAPSGQAENKVAGGCTPLPGSGVSCGVQLHF